MAAQAEPDLVVWGSVIPNLGWSNIARAIISVCADGGQGTVALLERV